MGDAKAEFEQKFEDAKHKIKEEHMGKAEEEEKAATREIEDQIRELREKAELEEAPLEWRKQEKSCKAKRQEAEDKLASTKKRLENLTGKTVDSPEDEKSSAKESRRPAEDKRKANKAKQQEAAAASAANAAGEYSYYSYSEGEDGKP